MYSGNQEIRVRCKARRLGYRVYKPRPCKHLPNYENHQGGYMLVEPSRNFCILGNRFDATLDEIEAFLLEKSRTRPRSSRRRRRRRQPTFLGLC